LVIELTETSPYTKGTKYAITKEKKTKSVISKVKR